MIYDYDDNYDNLPLDPAKRVTGWLVGIDGHYTGRDYRICYGYNWVGSDQTMDIRISDPSVAEKHHCAIVYDERHNKTFLLAQGESALLLDNQPVIEPVSLDSESIITIGSLRFYYIPFCRAERNWNIISSL